MFLEGLGLAIFLEKWGIREHHESLWSCVCLVEIDDKFKRVEMNLSSGNEYLTYFEFMKLYRVDKKNGVCLRVKLWMMIENELSYFT